MIYTPVGGDEIGFVLQYIAQRVEDFNPQFACGALASVTKAGTIKGAVAYQNYRTTDIEMVCAGEPGWLTPKNIGAFFVYPFVQLECKRVTVVCHRKNKHSREFVERLGWRLEGVHREAMADGHDAISYGLLRRECRWLDRYLQQNNLMEACHRQEGAGHTEAA